MHIKWLNVVNCSIYSSAQTQETLFISILLILICSFFSKSFLFSEWIFYYIHFSLKCNILNHFYLNLFQNRLPIILCQNRLQHIFKRTKKYELIIKTVSRRYVQTSKEDADTRLICIFMAISFCYNQIMSYFCYFLSFFKNIIRKTHFF